MSELFGVTFVWDWLFFDHNVLKVSFGVCERHAFDCVAYFTSVLVGYSEFASAGFSCFFWVKLFGLYGVSPFWHFFVLRCDCAIEQRHGDLYGFPYQE